MSKELVIGSNRHETKVAVLEDDQVVEVFFQRANEYSLAGSIHKGRVTRVLAGMQSAFVDIGLDRDAFLYVSDFFEEHEDIDTVTDDKPYRSERSDRRGRGGERRWQARQGPERAEERGAGERTVAIPINGESADHERAAGVDEEETALELDEAPVDLSAESEVLDEGEAAHGEVAGAVVAVAPPSPELNQSRGSESSLQPDRAADSRQGDSRTGDKRGRRSRRRRHRGRGFPENKYAQPQAIGGEQSEAAPASKRDNEDNREPVLILPGESLAKYRGAPDSGNDTEARVRTYERVDQLSAASDEADEGSLPEEDPEVEQAAIEEEAEELELAEKVLSHHDLESPVEVEEKIEEVKQDQPIEPDAAGEPRAPGKTVSSSNAPAAGEFSDSIGGEHLQGARSEEVPPVRAIELDEFEIETSDAEEQVELAEDGLESVMSQSDEAASGEQEDARQEGSAQTASVREQGGRYMHRVSRRMRRRRGGNRFSQGPGGEVSAIGSGAGTAAAMAPEPEAYRRETPEERTAPAPERERPTPSITELLKPGQEIIVQIAKEPLGQKGARITSHLALPGRYVVFMPSVSHLGVSRKIASEEERQRLKRILQAHRVGTTGGFIVRTAGEGVPEDDIAADMDFLYKLWLDIRQKAEKRPAPALLHYDLDIVQRILRDQVTEDFKAVWVDNEDMYENALTFMQRFQPTLVGRVKMYTRSAPIFDAFNITPDLERALRPKVWLKSGGYIVINQTEALVAIDINTGKYVGKSNRLEDTIVKTNTEAVKEIVRQIRLRDLGGIIVVDFIDMDERKNRQKVMQALEEAMRADKAPYKILQFNDFGLVAITRKRVKQSLERTLCSPCPHCEGAGYVKSVQTIIGEILVEAQKIASAVEGKDVMLRAHPSVARLLKSSDNRYLEELEEILRRPVIVTGDATLHEEKFDLA